VAFDLSRPKLNAALIYMDLTKGGRPPFDAVLMPAPKATSVKKLKGERSRSTVPLTGSADGADASSSRRELTKGSMPLTLKLLNETDLPDGGPVSFQLNGKCAVEIGRAAHLDWTLPDPTRFISNKHCEIRYKDGGYWLHDVSTNGTFLNGADHRMQAPHRLRNGDRFAVGRYLVAVTLEGAEEADDETRGAAVPLPAHVPHAQDLWADEGDVLPAIDPKQLWPARQNAPIDLSTDIPDPFRAPVADLPAQSARDPASLSALDDNNWPASPFPQPPPGEEQSSIGPVVHRGKKGPALPLSLPAMITHTSPLVEQPRTLCRRESSASLTKAGRGIVAAKGWIARRIEVLDLGRITSRWVIPAFGAGFLLTAIWFTAFFLTSSDNRLPPTTETTPALPLLTPADQGRPPDEGALNPPGAESPADNLSAVSADAISDEPAPTSTERPSPQWPEPVITPPPESRPATGKSPERPSTKLADRTSNAQPTTAPARLPVFEGSEVTYWRLISEKRRLRGTKRRDNQQVVLEDYVLAQPPHQGSSRSPDDEPTRSAEYVPVAADFLKAAAREFNFVPDRPATELEFKKAYAQLALSAGLNKDQIVRIYAFETGGNGTYDTQAGLEYHRRGERAVSSAIGYNQLLGTNSVELLAEHGDAYLQELNRIADKLTGPAKGAMQQKIEAVRRMVAFSRTVPDTWQEHDRLAKTTDGGRGIHAVMFDRDIGPLLQTQKLVDSLLYARKKGYSEPLTAAELELMNLTGDGNGFDMILMPPALRIQVPTANFFQQDGYERNPIARRTGAVAALIGVLDAQMDEDSQLPGARELATAF
jgi:pSer/pThr/pTyr-binding forkhead associated (FHA) protein